MPIYTYFCSKCQQQFDIKHSFKDKASICSLCGEKDSVEKMLNNSISVIQQIENKPGEVVKKYIDEMREQIKEQKEAKRDLK